MIKLFYDPIKQDSDIKFNGKKLELDHGLETAVFICLFTDRSAQPGDNIKGDDMRGHVHEAFAETKYDIVGSRFWTLYGAKLNEKTRQDCERFAKEALELFVARGIAKSVDAKAEIEQGKRIVLETTLTMPDADAPSWSKKWELTFNAI